MYKIVEYETWPFRIGIIGEDSTYLIAEVERVTFSTADSLDSVRRRERNISQMEQLRRLVDRANKDKDAAAEYEAQENERARAEDEGED